MKRLDSHVDEVIALINRRELEAAEQLARQLVTTAPGIAMNFHVFGMALLEQGKLGPAEEAFNRAIGLDSNNPASHLKRGEALAAGGRHGRAMKSFERALALSPNFAVARRAMADAQFAIGDLQRAEINYKAAIEANNGLHDAVISLSAVQQRLGKFDEALAALEWLLARDPRHGVAWSNRGSLFHQFGRYADAIESFSRAQEALPDVALVHDNLGMSLLAAGRAKEAILAHSKAIEINPALAIAYTRRAQAKLRLKQMSEALDDANEGVSLAPEHPMALNVRGVIQGEMGLYDEAMQDLRQAIQRAPKVVEFWTNAGGILIEAGDYQNALECLDQAILLRSDYPEAHAHRANALQQLGRLDDAVDAYDLALKNTPALPSVYKQRANLHLLRGAFNEGWRDYQHAVNLYRAPAQTLDTVPHWEGQSLLGKSIVLTEPNGLSEVFRLWRYIPKLLAMGADVFFLGPPDCFRILQSSQFNVRYLEQMPEGKSFDFRAELWTLPMALGTETSSIPDGVPYLHAEKERLETWQRILPLSTRNIGIVWQGAHHGRNDSSRAMRLLDLEPLSEVPGVRLVSLQQGEGREQLVSAKDDMRLILPDDSIDADYAFVDTAALIQRLDLVVAVDASVVHLAGAMGRPVWVALPTVPEWCWGLTGDSTPWYPSARLFRQGETGDWAGVVDSMRDALLTRRSAR